ncbi:MAG: biopolymer transporter ExbD [Alteromonadaceae bacterium]|nr:MAG: biopolymer transporter ExbD [Alteromonadaceae bacterium]
MRRRRLKTQEADLDITSFMNLMIILVPVLLMSMVFSHTAVLDLKLPDLASDESEPPKDDLENQALELVIFAEELLVNFPAGTPVKRIPKIPNEDEPETLDYDYKLLSDTLREIKRTLRLQDVEKKDILILSQQDTDYQTIVRVMDTVRSYKAVQVTSVVEAELFPSISLGDAPVNNLPSASTPTDATLETVK